MEQGCDWLDGEEGDGVGIPGREQQGHTGRLQNSRPVQGTMRGQAGLGGGGECPWGAGEERSAW